MPIKIEFARAFVTWAVTKKKLKSTTVKAYVSSFNIDRPLQYIGNVEEKNLNSDPCIKLALKGAKNLIDCTLTPKKDRLPMSVDLLRVLGHRISKLSWSDFSKQVFWTACTTSIFSSCIEWGKSWHQRKSVRSKFYTPVGEYKFFGK